MATPPHFTVAPFQPSARRWPFLALSGGLLLSLLVSGCSRKPLPPNASGTPATVTTPAAVSASATPSGEISYTEISEQYQAPVAEPDNGWPVVKPLMVPATPEATPPFDRLATLNLAQDKADQAFFDKDILPTLKSGFSKPAFAEPHPLLSGRDPLSSYYRNLRSTCDLLGQRAELLWTTGKKGEALETVALPLSLAKALQSRPETVSVNLFSSAYAISALGMIAEWARTDSLKGPELAQARKLLADHRPNFSHLLRCLSVDFAQLDNSINDEATRTEVLGLGLAKPEELKLWTEQLRTIKADAEKLYSFDPIDPQAFNGAVLKMSPQVQGLVLDYPELTTMQKYNYASYLATELALGLEAHRLSGSKKPLDASKLLEDTFGTDLEARKAAESLLEYQPGQAPGAFSIMGRGTGFKLMAPDGKVTFYERS